MITKDKLLETYNISSDMFATAGIAWEDLEYIYSDYFDRKYKIYQQILTDLIGIRFFILFKTDSKYKSGLYLKKAGEKLTTTWFTHITRTILSFCNIQNY